MFRELAAGHPDRQAPGVNATGWPAQGPSVTDQRGANLRPCSRLDTDSTVSLAQSAGKNKENFIVYFLEVTSILGCPRPAPGRPDRQHHRCRKLRRGVGGRWSAVPIYPLQPTGESFKKEQQRPCSSHGDPLNEQFAALWRCQRQRPPSRRRRSPVNWQACSKPCRTGGRPAMPSGGSSPSMTLPRRSLAAAGTRCSAQSARERTGQNCSESGQNTQKVRLEAGDIEWKRLEIERDAVADL